PPDNRSRCGRLNSLVAPDNAVAVLVDATSARGECHRVTHSPVDRERAERPKAMAHHVDGNSGDAMSGHGGGKPKWKQFLVATVSVADNRYRPAAEGFIA